MKDKRCKSCSEMKRVNIGSREVVGDSKLILGLIIKQQYQKQYLYFHFHVRIDIEDE